jgi:hypothetical protein
MLMFKDVERKAKELGLIECGYWDRANGNGVCQWNKTGEIDKDAAIEIEYTWKCDESVKHSSYLADRVVKVEIDFEELDIVPNDSLPYGGLFN